MNYKLVIQFLGKILMLESVFMIPALIVSFIYGGEDAPAFLISMGILLATGYGMSCVRAEKTKMYARDGLMIVSLAWVLVSFFGALPAYIDRSIPNLVDAFFESISGFTTTGSSILREVESLPKGILFWRSLSHWFGGMGVLVFSVILLPSMSGQTQHLMRAESPGPTMNKLVPRIKDTSKILYGIYAVMTVACVIALLLAGMPLYDALIHAFGAAGTGGFSNKNTSVAFYDSTAVDMILSVFMILFGINFSIYFMLLKRKFSEINRNDELKMFLLIVGVSTLLITVNIWGESGGVFKAFRYAFFQVSTIISTTGYATADFNLWPAMSKFILVLLMFAGSCAGSTAGGLKQIRLVVMFKAARRSARKLAHPRSVVPIRADGKVVSDEQVMNIGVFVFAYIAIIAGAVILISADNFDMETSFSAVLATISNIGPGFGVVGPVGNFADFSAFSKLVLCFCMLAGRLEIFPLLFMFRTSSWKRS